MLCQAEPHITPSGKKRRMWHCRCDCGNEKDVDQQMLLSGRTKSCGCNRWVKGKQFAADLSGKYYGQLEVIRRAGSNNRSAPTWLCRCHRCGREAVFVGYTLHKRSDCGCSLAEKRADLSGTTVRNFDIIRRTGKKKTGEKIYLCRCKLCGREINITAAQIRSTRTNCVCQNPTPDLKYDPEHIKELIKKGRDASYVDGVNINSVFKEDATKRSKTGVRGVYPESRRPGQYVASCQVHGERWSKGGFVTIARAKEARDKAQAELIEKYNVKNPKGEKNA